MNNSNLNKETKICRYCGQVKPSTEFEIYQKQGRIIQKETCQHCLKIAPESSKIRQKDIDIQNGFKTCWRCQQQKNLECFEFQPKRKGFYPHCKQCRSDVARKHNQIPEVRERRLKRCTEYNKTERAKQQKRNYNHQPETKELRNKWYRDKSKTDPGFRIKNCLRSRIQKAIRIQGSVKNQRTMDLIGCDIKYLKKHLESQFEPGMTWDNYGFGIGKWSIDHIIPCKFFDLTNSEEQRKCFHYSNLRPMWFQENAAKIDRLPDGTLARNLKKPDFLPIAN